jgi:hypothetical protein
MSLLPFAPLQLCAPPLPKGWAPIATRHTGERHTGELPRGENSTVMHYYILGEL